MTSGFIHIERQKRKSACISGVFTTPDYSRINTNPEITEEIKRYLYRLS